MNSYEAVVIGAGNAGMTAAATLAKSGVRTLLLERHNIQVVTAKDGLDAVAMLQTQVPDLAILDIEMPRMDGFDLVRNIRADEKMVDMPVIMITSRIAQKHRDYAEELGVNHYLGKPYGEEELLELVGRYALHPESAHA